MARYSFGIKSYDPGPMPEPPLTRRTQAQAESDLRYARFAAFQAAIALHAAIQFLPLGRADVLMPTLNQLKQAYQEIEQEVDHPTPARPLAILLLP